jgi:hypothetical protein
VRSGGLNEPGTPSVGRKLAPDALKDAGLQSTRIGLFLGVAAAPAFVVRGHAVVCARGV